MFHALFHYLLFNIYILITEPKKQSIFFKRHSSPIRRRYTFSTSSPRILYNNRRGTRSVLVFCYLQILYQHNSIQFSRKSIVLDNEVSIHLSKYQVLIWQGFLTKWSAQETMQWLNTPYTKSSADGICFITQNPTSNSLLVMHIPTLRCSVFAVISEALVWFHSTLCVSCAVVVAKIRLMGKTKLSCSLSLAHLHVDNWRTSKVGLLKNHTQQSTICHANIITTQMFWAHLNMFK